MDWRRQGETVVIASGVVGAVAAIVMFTIHATGGHLPPWQTVEMAENDKRSAAAIQESTVNLIKQLNAKVDGVKSDEDGMKCEALRLQLAQANVSLAKNPNDPSYQALQRTTLGQMRSIPNCAP